eukprot:scaffold4214_cov172-Amphora_coffeaeformis.AAC.5
MSADPPARHIREECSCEDDPSSYIVTNHGEFKPASEHKKPSVVLASAQICNEYSTVSQQQLAPTAAISTQEVERSEIGSADSLVDVWQRRGQQVRKKIPLQPSLIVARAVEVSAVSHRQHEPSTAFLSQSRILPSGEDAPSMYTQRYNTVSPAVEPFSRVAEATVLSERTWSSFDQYRSGIAQADPLHVPAPTQAVVVTTRRLVREKLEDSGRGQPSSVALPCSNASQHVPPQQSQQHEHRQQRQLHPQSTDLIGTKTTAASSSSANMVNPTDTTEAASKNIKKSRKRLTAAVTAGGLIVGAVLSPFAAVPLAAAGYSVTRQAGKHRECKFKEHLEEDEEDSHTRDVTNQHSARQDDAGAPTRSGDGDAESELDLKTKQRFKAEGQSHKTPIPSVPVVVFRGKPQRDRRETT